MNSAKNVYQYSKLATTKGALHPFMTGSTKATLVLRCVIIRPSPTNFYMSLRVPYVNR